MAFWRGLSRICMIYLLFLVFLIYQNVNDARQLFKYFDPSLGQYITSEVHTYDDHCELEWANFVDNLDHYYVVHCVNWLFAAFICRDAYILFFWQFLDEIIELSA
jgi:phosphatidylserine synthase 2